MSISRHHNEWLSLVPNSGPFLSLPVLTQAFPQGLNAHDAEHARRLRMAFSEWDENQIGKRPESTIHRAWIKFVLAETLGYDELLADGQAIPQTLKSEVAEYGETLRPDWIVNDPSTKNARLLIQAYSRSQSLTKPIASSKWKTSPDTRMMQLLHDTGIRLGIVTNGDQWMLVNAPKSETSGYVSWYANLWQEESITLRAFRTILGADRLFSVPDNETLEALLTKSAADQQEVTDQLGYQVRKAVEVLIQSLDKADQDHGRKLLADVDEKVLYESALTVMMRLVFLFCAEERELLLLGDELYDKNYAVSTLREQLRVTADQFGEEILGLRYDAWARLLTTFRAVYAGVKHDRLKLPAYGGSLFNPDRYPFLEGRKLSTSWKNTEATPLPISNRTVLHLLEALQVLQIKLPGGAAEARKLSFRSLDIEQIGHVYEGLLDHTAKRATEPMLGLQGTRDKEPEIALTELERLSSKGEKELLKFLNEYTGKQEPAIKRLLSRELDAQLISRFRTTSQDNDLWDRLKPFAGLIRMDSISYPTIITTGSVFVTAGTDRRSSGTHYTPKILTEPIVQHTLEPLVYIGPAEGLPRDQWQLRSAKELLSLKICDMACGSGAFLVQVCRYLSARLLEAWDALYRSNPGSVRITPDGDASSGLPGEMLIPDDLDERQTFALRIVAQRCIYGVDINPLAVEMAKLSLWLLTLAKDKPFEFLDHNIRCGDSLVGIHSLDQLRRYNLKPETDNETLLVGDDAVDEVIALRLKIEDLPSNTVEDVQRQEKLLQEANEKISGLRCAADLLVAAEFWGEKARDKVERSRSNYDISKRHLENHSIVEFEQLAAKERRGQRMFHWPLEFPEVIVKRGGFDGFVGNPPFMGGSKLATELGVFCRDYLVDIVSNGRRGQRGQADLCGYFLCRLASTVRPLGHFGILATNTISQGDTRVLALDHLVDSNFSIYRAVSSQKWPGTANLEVAAIWLRKGIWAGLSQINGITAESITPYLTATETVTGSPLPLVENEQLSFEGIRVEGTGFVLDSDSALELIAKGERNGDVLFTYLRGDDFLSSPHMSPCCWVINFNDWPLDKESAPDGYVGPVASDYPDCLEIVVNKVKPQRLALPPKNAMNISAAARWWQYRELRPTLQAALKKKSRVLFHAFTSKYIAFGFVDCGCIFAAPHNVFAFDDFGHFASLQCTFHVEWAYAYCSTLETRLRYTRGSIFETFPFAKNLVQLEHVGATYHSERSHIMLNRQEGLTKTYNRFHDPDEFSSDIQKLRDLHVEMDQGVAAAYGWTDLDLGHGFNETQQGVRFTISESARREVLQRLLKLNHERYAEEEKQGLHSKKGAAKKAAPQKKATSKQAKKESTLFDMEDDE